MGTLKNEIFVFKTNIKYKKDISKIAPSLAINGIAEWNVDRSDIDCVLRVVATTLTSKDITSIITANGYNCSELN